MDKKAILVVSWHGTLHLAKKLLEQLQEEVKYPIIVAITEIESLQLHEEYQWIQSNFLTFPVEGNRWELGGLQSAFLFTDYEEFILIQDTLEVIDSSIFEQMFAIPGSVSYGPTWQCYLGKYRREIIQQIPFPVVLTKTDAFYWEVMYFLMYAEVCRTFEGKYPHIMKPEWGNDNPKNYIEEKFGRENFVMWDEHLLKRKSTKWNLANNVRATIIHTP